MGFRRIVHPAGREGSPRRELDHALTVELTKTRQAAKPHQSAVRFFLLFLLFFKLEEISPFCGANDTIVLDF